MGAILKTSEETVGVDDLDFDRRIKAEEEPGATSVWTL